MKKFLAAAVALSLLTGCGGDKNDTADDNAALEKSEEPIKSIPDQNWSEFALAANASLRPYFDEAGTDTQLAVGPGDYFDFWVVAEFDVKYPMSAAEYRVGVPEGVTVLNQVNCDSTIVVVGDYWHDFIMAFNCSRGPKMWLVKYHCRVNEEFGGGPITTEAGHDFMGFTLCDQERTMIPAKGATATLAKK